MVARRGDAGRECAGVGRLRRHRVVGHRAPADAARLDARAHEVAAARIGDSAHVVGGFAPPGLACCAATEALRVAG